MWAHSEHISSSNQATGITKQTEYRLYDSVVLMEADQQGQSLPLVFLNLLYKSWNASDKFLSHQMSETRRDDSVNFSKASGPILVKLGLKVQWVNLIFFFELEEVPMNLISHFHLYAWVSLVFCFDFGTASDHAVKVSRNCDFFPWFQVTTPVRHLIPHSSQPHDKLLFVVFTATVSNQSDWWKLNPCLLKCNLSAFRRCIILMDYRFYAFYLSVCLFVFEEGHRNILNSWFLSVLSQGELSH